MYDAHGLLIHSGLLSTACSSYCNSVCEKFQTTRAKVAPVIFIYGSHFSATEATYKVSLKMVNFVQFTRTFTRIRR